MMMYSNRFNLLIVFCLVATTYPSQAHGQSQEVVLKNGIPLVGRVYKSLAISSQRRLQGTGDRGSYHLVDQKFKRYFIPNRFVASVSPDEDLKRESFKLKHRIISKKKIPDFIGSLRNVTPWDQNGVRTVTLQTQRGPITVTQAMWELTPKYVWVRSLNYDWKYGIPTTSIDAKTLDKVLRSAINWNNPNDRIAVCRYLMDAGKLVLADSWVRQATTDFPAFKDPCKAATIKLRQLFARQLIGVLEDRSKAGQHQLVRKSLEQFKLDDLPTEVLNSVNRMKGEYAAKETAITKIHSQLELLQGALDAKLQSAVEPLRIELKDNLSYSSLDRMRAYMNLAKDQTLKPEERLSIAFSGWMLGSANAMTSLPETLGIAKAREHVEAYLSSDDPLVHRRAVDELSRLEGVSPRTLKQLLLTSPPLEPPEIAPGKYLKLRARAANGPASYSVVLPPEYSPFQSYPLIVALKQAGQPGDAQLAFWSGTLQQPGQGQRRGYIVIAPDYEVPGARDYTSNALSHNIVLSTMRDAFRRFSIDTDRVFLVGHGTGANAVFDIGMSYPGVFAGAIPICGVIGPEGAKLTANGATLPWYVVTGEKHLSLDRNASVLHQIAISKRNEKLLVCEYKDRGYEGYYDEIQRMFDWMDDLSREELSKEFTASAVRPETYQYHWIEASEFPEYLSDQDFTPGKQKNTLRSIEFDFRLSKANKLTIRRCGAKGITLRLLDGVVDFGKTLRVSGSKFPRPISIDPRPAIADVLEDFRIYRDRKRIALQRVRL